MALTGVMAWGGIPAIHGLPFTRSYPLEDIGLVPRGARLDFDRYGRLAAIHDAVYAVLNDNVWLNIAEPGGVGRILMTNVCQAPDGRSYYGGRGTWGLAEVEPDGRLHAVPITPPNPPSWTLTADFMDLIVTPDGVYFASRNGVVYWDFRKKQNSLFEIPSISQVIQVGNRVYISAYDQPLSYIDVENKAVKSAAGTELDKNVVEFSTPLDEAHSLVSFVDGRLAVFDGHSVSPWVAKIPNGLTGHLTVLRGLVDGRIAVGITGQGLFLFSREGELLAAFTTSEYHNITALANREPGVLWVVTEEAIKKVLYGSPLSAFGQGLGLPVGWPIVVSLNGQIFVASEGKLYKAVAGAVGESSRFELQTNQPPNGAWALAAWGPHMLVGNGYGVFSVEPDGSYRSVAATGDLNLAYLVIVDPEHCYAIGRAEIALLEWQHGRWTESVPRIPGVGHPFVVHRVKNEVWIEMGGDGVGHLWLKNGRLQFDVVTNASWTRGSWVNIGAVDDTVVLSALQEEPRRFFDQTTGSWCDAPQLQQLLNRSPYWIARPAKDETGIIWATHNDGLVRFTPHGGDYDMDTTSFELTNDRYPVVTILPGNDVWLTAERSLYHVDRPSAPPASRPSKPVLVSMVDVRRGAELLTRPFSAFSPIQLPYAKNSLTFRFYSGSDAWRRAPVYEYRLNENEPWTVLDGSVLSIRDLREGNYDLQVRAAGQRDFESPATFPFEIRPPWPRTWPAYALFGSFAVLVLFGVTRWSSYITHKRNRVLERLVRERTSQLEVTMAKLNGETRNAATLAERNRLANEIHDSVQQGLTGAILQLDTTLKLPVVSGNIRSRLGVVRNMISYARQEVQHAVWDMESPLLEGTQLADALRNLTTFVNSGDADIDVSVSGRPMPLPRQINHNLLRIAQEATTNAFRHAKAQRISVRLEYGSDSETVSLAISDDGIGFRVDDVLQNTTGHLGLKGIRARVKQIRGELLVRSSPGEGTSIRVVVPFVDRKDVSDNGKTKQR